MSEKNNELDNELRSVNALPPSPLTQAEMLADIYTPSLQANNIYDFFNALKDLTLTYTQSPEERNVHLLALALVDSLVSSGMDDCALMIASEVKAALALARSHHGFQQKELTTARHKIERNEAKKQKGLFEKSEE